MNSISLSVILLIWPIVSSEDSSLCSDTYIYAADRLPNDTYRVYRGNYYWELSDLPNKVAKVSQPYRVRYKYMAPITADTKLYTVIGGNTEGTTYKFVKERRWRYNKNGGHAEGGNDGETWTGFPTGGFSAVYCDGDMFGKGFPLVIAFGQIDQDRVFYFNNKNLAMTRIGPAEGTVGGNFGEKFPSNITAAFAFKTNDPKAQYFVYLFRKDKYCYRPITGEDGCLQWRDTKELFGCYAANTNSETQTQTQTEQTTGESVIQSNLTLSHITSKRTTPTPGGIEAGITTGGNPSDFCGQNFVLFLSSIYILLKFLI